MIIKGYWIFLLFSLSVVLWATDQAESQECTRKLEGIQHCKPNEVKPCQRTDKCSSIIYCYGATGTGTKTHVESGACVTEHCDHHYDEAGIDHPSCTCLTWLPDACSTIPVSCFEHTVTVPAHGSKCDPTDPCVPDVPVDSSWQECDGATCPHETCH